MKIFVLLVSYILVRQVYCIAKDPDGVPRRVQHPNYLDSIFQRYIVDVIRIVWKQTKADHQIVTPGAYVRVSSEHSNLRNQFVDGLVGKVTTIAGNERPYFVLIVVRTVGKVSIIKLGDLHLVPDG